MSALRRTAATALLATLAVACGGGGGGSSYQEPKGPAQQTVKIEAGNLYFKPDSVRLPAGIDAIELVEKGGTHTLLIEGVTGFKLQVAGEGSTDTKKVRLKPGRYTFFCDLPGHRAAGMQGTITVT